MFRIYFIKRRLKRENYKINKRRRINRQFFYTVSFNEFVVGWVEFLNEKDLQYEKVIEFENKEDAKKFIEDQILINYRKI